MAPLEGKVAVVAGAARGAGRGVARMLGEAGAVVFCTGRSTRDHPPTGRHAGRPETIEETADMVNDAGGVGLAVRVDHSDEAQVTALFDRVRSERGGLDLLVNVLGADHAATWGPFWEQPHDAGRALVDAWLWPHVLTARLAAMLMLERKRGLLVEVVEGETLGYHGTFYWDLAMSLLKRMSYGMAEELAPQGITALAVAPGFMRTEEVLAHFGTTADSWRDVVDTEAARNFGLAGSETPCFVGRGITALAADPDVHRRTGSLCCSWELAKEYGFSDVDGATPDWGPYFRENFPQYAGPSASGHRWGLMASQ